MTLEYTLPRPRLSPPRLAVIAAGLALLLGSTAVQAADEATPAFPTGWTITVTGTIGVAPLYDGARRYGLDGMPGISWRRIGEPDEYSAPDDSFDLTLFDAGPFSVGPVVNLRSGRSRSDDSNLTGLDSVPWTVEAGIFVNYWLLEDKLRARVELRQGLRSEAGLSGDLAIDWVQRFGAFTLSGGPRLTFGNATFMDTNFGITPAEAAANGRVKPYDPSGGVQAVGVMTALGYKWSDTWTTTVFGRYDRLVGSAGDSPISTTLGSRDQFAVGVSVAYSFDWVTNFP